MTLPPRPRLMTGSYLLLGRRVVPAVTLETWAENFERANRRVATTEVGPLRVSTVFLGLDHSFSDHGPPLLFETMIFGAEAGSEWSESYCERCSTYDEAEEMHKQGVAAAEKMLAEINVRLAARRQTA